MSQSAVIYMRVSSPKQEENYSLPQQEADCRAYCEKQGYSIHAVYNDGAQHSYTLHRPGFNKALNDIRKGRAGIIVVGKYDRLSRSQLQAAAFRYQVTQQYGGRVESVKEPAVTDNPVINEKLISDYFFVAEMERRDITTRTQGGRRARALDGKLIAGPHPLYGYNWGDADVKRGKSFYVPNPDTAPVVRRIYQEYAMGTTLEDIVLHLEAEGIPTPFGYLASKGLLSERQSYSKVWTRGTLRRILTNPAYIGKPAAFRNKSKYPEIVDEYTGETREVHRASLRTPDDPEYVALSSDVCPALVDEEIWYAVQARLTRNRAEAARNNSNIERSLLRAGYIVCGYCGANLSVRTTQGKEKRGLVYACRRATDNGAEGCPGGYFSIRVPVMDDDVWFFIRYLLSRPEMIQDAIERLRDVREEEDSRAEERSASYAALRRKLDSDEQNLLSGLREASNPSVRAAILKELEDVTRQRERLAEEEAALAADAVERLAGAQQIHDLETLMRRVSTNLDKLTYKQKRALLYALGLKVTAWRVEHQPRYRIRCDFEGLRTGLDVSMFDIDDQQLAALRAGAEQPELIPVHCVADYR